MARNQSNYDECPEQFVPQGLHDQMNQFIPSYYYYNGAGFDYSPVSYGYTQPRQFRTYDNSLKHDASEMIQSAGDKEASKQFFKLVVDRATGLPGSAHKNKNEGSVPEAKAEEPTTNAFLLAINEQKGKLDVKPSNSNESFFKRVQDANAPKSGPTEAASASKPVNEPLVEKKILDKNAEDQKSLKKPPPAQVVNEQVPGMLVRKTVNAQPQIKHVKYGTCINGYVSYTKEETEAITFSSEEFAPFINRITKLLIQLKAKPVVKKGVGAWKGMSEKLEEGLHVSNEEKFTYRLLSIFNKLSLQSYHLLFNEFVKIGIATISNVNEYISLVFDKATKEPSFCYLYADFVKRSFRVLDKADTENVGLVKFLKERVNDLILKTIERDKQEEEEIAKLKAFKSNDEDKVDEVLSELAEREKTYKKPKLGALQFASELCSVGAIDLEFIYRIFTNFRNCTDLFEIELLSKFMQNSGDLLYGKDRFKALFDEELSRMEILAPKLPFDIRFSIIDTVKMKSEGFKNTIRKTVPTASEAQAPAATISNKQKVMKMLEMKNKNKNQGVNSRDRNTRGRHLPGFSKPQSKFLGLENEKILMDDESVPAERPRAPVATKSAPYRPTKLAAPRAAADTEKLKVEVTAPEKKINLEAIVTDLFIVEFDVDEAFFETRDYQMNKYALEFCKIGLRVILENKRMHLSFGLLLVRLISSFAEFKECILAAITHVMEDLPMNAMDEPVLWKRFYFVLIPLLCANCVTIDQIVKIMSGNEEIGDPVANMVDLFDLCNKDLPVARVFKIMYWNRNSENLKKVLKIRDSFNDLFQMSLENEQNNLLDDFYDTSIDNAVISKMISVMYTDKDLALMDIARETYLNCLIGKEFNSGLTNILATRKELFSGVFKEEGNRKFIRYFMDRVIRFDSKFELFSYIGFAMCKAEHVDTDWLKGVPSTIQNEQFREKISIQVGNVMRQLEK